MVNSEIPADSIYSNSILYDRMWEPLYRLAVKSESLRQDGFQLSPTSYLHRTQKGDGEADLVRDGLLWETAMTRQEPTLLDREFTDRKMVRVITDAPGTKEQGIYHRIGYPEALLMLSRGNIRKKLSGSWKNAEGDWLMENERY
jgi:hypothetical protein